MKTDSSQTVFNAFRQRRRILTAGIGSLFVLSNIASHAITITSGTTTLTFDTAPGVADWATLAAGLGAAGAGTFTTSAGIDAAVAGLNQASITEALPTSGTNPPSTNASARFNTSLLALQTRPTTVGATLLLGKLSNGTGQSFTDITIGYTLAGFNATAEEVNGLLAYFSLNGTTWAPLPSLGGGTPGVLSQNIATAGWAPGTNAYLLFVDDNGSPTDGSYTLDNMTFTPTLQAGGANLTWNTGHSVGGAPGGSFEVSAAQYWLNGASPSGFAVNDNAIFSQNPSTPAAITVPADIAASSVIFSHTAGTYSLGGPGKISSSFAVTSTGEVAITSDHTVFGTTISGGGKVITSSAGALGAGSVTTGAGGGTLETVTNLSVGALNGAGLLTKTGAGVLTLTSTGAATGGLQVNEGSVSTNSGAALGAAANTVTLNGTTLEFTNVGAATTVVPVVAIGSGGGTVSIADASSATASGATFGAGRLTGSTSLTKAGPGVLRISGAQAGLTSNWTVNAGVVEVSNATGLGTGSVTLNSGVLVLNGVTVTNNVALAGGALGTRTNSNGNFAGTVNVTSNSFLNVKSSSSPAGYQGFTVSGVVSGASDLTLTGPIPLIANGTVAAGTAAVFANTANTYSGNFNVTSQQILASNPTGGAGSALGTATLRLKGGGVRILDDGTASDSILTYNNPVFVETQTEIGALAGTAGIHVDRTTTGTFTGNTVQFSSLNIGGGLGLAVTGANGYKASVSGATTLSGTGVATFDTSTAALTLAGGVTGTGGLGKTGASTLTLQGTVNYSGNTAVDGGVLDVTGVTGGFSVGTGQTLSGSGGTVTGAPAGITVGSGAIIAPGNTSGVGVLTLSSLSLGTAAINYAWNTGTLGSLTVLGSDALALTGGTGSVTLNFASQSPNLGLHTLIDYTGTPLADLTKFTVGSMFSRIAYSLVNNTTDTKIELNVTGLNYPIWSGATSSEWSTNVITAPKNWKLSSDNSNTDFIAGDRVVFNDAAASASPTVDVSVANVSPLSVEVDGTKDYTFTGTAAIAGAGGLTKTGTGKLTISSTNSFTGTVNLNGGVTAVATIADSATNSPLGAGTAINLGGGTLEFTGATGSTNRGIAVAVGGGTVSTPTGSTLTLAGVVSGAGTLAKSGAGTVVLTGATNTVAGYTVSQGTLQVGDGVAAGSLGTGTVTNDATLAFNTPAAGLVVGNVISGTGSVTKTGPGNVTLNGAADNTYAGTTTVSGGSLILSSPTGINSVGGNVVVETGGIVAYGTTAGQLANHIPDTASITVNGGTFGSGAGNAETGPTAGIFDTVANVTVNSGTFLSGRGDAQPFGVTGALNATGGRVFLQRGGSVAATSISLASGVVLDMDGGSTGFISRLGVGTGGLTIHGATVNMNTGSNVTAGSQGSSIILTGDLTTTGTTTISRVSAQAAPRANIDLNGADRVFNVSGTLTLGTSAAQVIVVNTGATPGGIVKQGAGNLVLNGANTYNGNTDILAGTVTLTGTLSGSASINVATGSTFDVSGAAGYSVGVAQTIKGNGNVVGSATINGTLAPGSSIGTLNFANDLAFGATGAGLFEINKIGLVRTADLANVTGTLTLAGTLNVTATGDTLVEGDKFNLFDAAAFSGTMAMGTMPTLDPGLFWSLADLGVDGTISVIPEPGSAALLALGSALLFRRRRKA
ncbi:MAG: hypothetical protein RL088_54 [Verrucomicrobiota bacterium]|jgi:autotransporter-associated beta strand protein